MVYYNFFSNKRVTKKNITANPVAYGWYTKAEFRITPENKVDLDSAIFFLTKAIEADSTFALAHAALSYAYSLKHYFINPKGGYSEKAFVEAETSLYLNPNLAEGTFALAFLNWNFQNKFPHERTIREFKKAIDLNPNMDEAYHWLGVVYIHVGLVEDALIATQKALLLNPNNKFTAVDLASTYFFRSKDSDLEIMIDLFKKTPDPLISPFRISQWATGLISLGRLDEAESILSEALKKDSSNLFINSTLAVLMAKKGDRNGAINKIELCERSNLYTGHMHHAVYNLAVAYGMLGELEKSVNKLNWVVDNGLPNYTLFSNDKLLAPLHKYPPYLELIERLKVQMAKYKEIADE